MVHYEFAFMNFLILGSLPFSQPILYEDGDICKNSIFKIVKFPSEK